MNKTSKSGVIVTSIIAVLVIGIVWFVIATTRDDQASNLSVSTPYGDISDRAVQNDFNKVDGQFNDLEAEARDMDSYNL